MCIAHEDDNKVIGYKILCFSLILRVCLGNFKKNYRRMVLKWRKAWYQTSMHTYIINCWNLYFIQHYYVFVIVGFSAFCETLPFMFRIFRMVIHEFCIIYSSIFNVLLNFEDLKKLKRQILLGNLKDPLSDHDIIYNWHIF